ncbi:MAG: hypothetical protein RJB39_461 [Candidatus Parcubacteria bacterium]
MQWIDASPFRKNIAVVILVFIALALITGTVLLYKNVSSFGMSANNPQVISVTGRAEEFIKPDTLVFSITVNEDGTDVVSASKKVDAKVASALAVLKSNGVEEKNIKTTSREVNDTYGNQSCPTQYTMPGAREIAMPPCTTSKVIGVNVYQTLEVKVQNIDKDTDGSKQNKLISDLTTANIKTGQVSFTVYDTDEVKVRVRAEAIKKAKANAKILARDLGVDLDKLQSFGDSGTANPYPFMSERAEMAPSMMAKDAVSNASVPTGEQKISTEVTLTYLIK